MTAGVDAVFRCRHSDADFIGWKVNNVSIGRDPLPGVSVGAGTLTILALPEFNGTVVECLAFFISGTAESAPPVMLIVQGKFLG